jgi:hypothetical protein
MSNISMTPVRTGGVAADVTLKVGGGIRVGGMKVKGAVEVENGGGSAPVTEARWGQIEGNIESQLDLMTALNEKLTTPSGTNGQFMSLVNGVWTAVDLPTYEGGVN